MQSDEVLVLAVQNMTDSRKVLKKIKRLQETHSYPMGISPLKLSACTRQAGHSHRDEKGGTLIF
jgi:2-iminoacetate synthase ThiH